MAQLEESLDRYYLEAMNTAARTQSETAAPKAIRLNEKIAKLKQQMQKLQAMEQRLKSNPGGQVSLTDPDARVVSGLQRATAVDSKYHLVVAHEVTKVGYTRAALASIAKQAHHATGAERLPVVADRSYFDGKEIRTCELKGTYTPTR